MFTYLRADTDEVNRCTSTCSFPSDCSLVSTVELSSLASLLCASNCIMNRRRSQLSMRLLGEEKRRILAVGRFRQENLEVESTFPSSLPSACKPKSCGESNFIPGSALLHECTMRVSGSGSPQTPNRARDYFKELFDIQLRSLGSPGPCAVISTQWQWRVCST